MLQSQENTFEDRFVFIVDELYNEVKSFDAGVAKQRIFKWKEES